MSYEAKLDVYATAEERNSTADLFNIILMVANLC